MIDFRSGHEWASLNATLVSNFKDVLSSMSSFKDEDSAPLINAFHSFTSGISSTLSDVKVLWSGSFMEGSLMDPRFREQGFESDVMFVPMNFILSPSQQRDMFRHKPGTPGYVNLEVTDVYQPTTFLEETGVGCRLDVKAIKGTRDEPTRYYVIKKLHSSDETHPQHPFADPDNVLMRSVVDTFGLDRIFCSSNPGSPAVNIAMSGLRHIGEHLKGCNSPKSLLFRFVGNVCNRLNEAPNNNPTQASNTSQDILASLRGSRSFDYVCPPASHGGEARNESPDALSLDCVLAIECVGWPDIARGYLQRKRSWPDSNILAKLRRGGFHLVYKPLVKDSVDSVEWRISFSMAELTLFDGMNSFRRKCYRTFKALYYCELTLPKILCSYYMKTIFLWMCERLPKEASVKSNLAQIIMALLDELMHCLVTKNCPHYFIPECNLFAHAHEDFLLDLARKVSEIRTHPERYPTRLRSLETELEDEDTGSETSSDTADPPSRIDDIDLD